MNSYIIRGHGELMPSLFYPGQNQYVVFVTKCGMYAHANTTLNARVQEIISNSEKLTRYIRGNYNKSKLPPAFRNLKIISPGQLVANMKIEMVDENRPNYEARFGIFKNGVYQFGRKSSIQLSRFLRQRGPGIFFIDSCRGPPNTTLTNEQGSNIARRLRLGLPVNLPGGAPSPIIEHRRYERNVTARFARKRPTARPNISLRKKSPSIRPTKRRRISNQSPVAMNTRHNRTNQSTVVAMNANRRTLKRKRNSPSSGNSPPKKKRIVQ